MGPSGVPVNTAEGKKGGGEGGQTRRAASHNRRADTHETGYPATAAWQKPNRDGASGARGKGKHLASEKRTAPFLQLQLLLYWCRLLSCFVVVRGTGEVRLRPCCERELGPGEGVGGALWNEHGRALVR